MNKIVRAMKNYSSLYSPLSPLCKKLNSLTPAEIFELELAKFVHQLQNNKLPKLFQHLFSKTDSVQLCVVTIQAEVGSASFKSCAASARATILKILHRKRFRKPKKVIAPQAQPLAQAQV